MLVDTTTPEGSVRALIIPSNESSITRTIAIQRDSFVCDQSVRIYAPVRTELISVGYLKNCYPLLRVWMGGSVIHYSLKI